MAKKRRTAAQKRATAKLVAMNKRKKRSTRKGGVRKTARRAYMGLRKRTTIRRKSTPLKTRKRRKNMARKGLKSITGSSTLKKAALGVGGATMASIAAAALFPQFRNIAEPAGAYIFGGIEGIAANFALGLLKGRTGNGTAQNAAPAMEVL
jgi:hypothetical protein